MLYAVIMAGGRGTRFWPESRRSRPKQFLSIAGEKSMIRTTLERIVPEIPLERIIVVTGIEHSDEVRTQLPELNEDAVVAEPQGRNTAPCVALAAYKIAKRDPEGLMAVFPTDQLIGREDDFREALRTASKALRNGHYLVTFGIVPDRPETGYGYIELGDAVIKVGPATVHKVESFVEKPDRAKAIDYLASGRYVWNSGMFMWKVVDIIHAFERYLPKLSDLMNQIIPVLNTDREQEALERVYECAEAISIDHGIMEKATNVLCIPVDIDWNDVGHWASIRDVWPCDERGNATRGEVVSLDSKDCIVSSPHRLTSLVEVADLIIVDTPDALLICRKDRAQEVVKLQEILEDRGYQHLL